MPEGVTYTKRSEAAAYAESVGGIVVPVDADGDGVTDGYIVKPPPGIEEGPTRGPNPSELGSPQEAAGAPEGENGELGYRQGGMNFNNRGPVKYSKGGAVKGRKFKGSF
jgi:hypothetical protein